MKKLFTSLFLLVLFSCSNEKKTDSEIFIAGFRTIHSKDTSRMYKSKADTTHYLYHRPLDIDIWYPAVASSKDTSLYFRNLLGLLETRANYYTASNVGNGFAKQMAQFFCESLNCSDSSKVLNYKTDAYKNAMPAKGKFPLVIYLSSFNGMGYENFTLFEQLAKKGFVVVSINSIGRFPGDMTMKYEDLMEQVNDAVSTLEVLKGSDHIDFDRIGIVGYSWGGLAGTILANKIPQASCLISLDGSEYHHYGTEKEEDIDFNSIVGSAEFTKMKLSTPYLRLESAQQRKKSNKDSVYYFSKNLSDKPQIIVIDSAKHEDFGCLVNLVKRSGNCKTHKQNDIISRITISYLQDKLQKHKTFITVIKEETTRNTIRKK